METPILYPYQKAWLEDDSRFKIGHVRPSDRQDVYDDA